MLWKFPPVFTLELHCIGYTWESSLQTEHQQGNSAFLCSLGQHTVFSTLVLFVYASDLQNVGSLVGYPFPFLFLTPIVSISWFMEFQLALKNAKKCLNTWASWVQSCGKQGKNATEVPINLRTNCFHSAFNSSQEMPSYVKLENVEAIQGETLKACQ